MVTGPLHVRVEVDSLCTEWYYPARNPLTFSYSYRSKEGGDMAQDTLVRKLDEAVHRAELLVRERDEAMAKIRSLERETGHLRSLISLAESKADEMLKGVSTADASNGPVTLKASRGHEELKRLFPRAFISDF
jgi:hypothetical protein